MAFLDDDVVSCPICEAMMVYRENSKNGNGFYGCASFPNCDHTMSLETYRRELHEEGCREVGEHPDPDDHPPFEIHPDDLWD